MSKRYAANTSVSVSSSKEEIERTLKRYGADAFGYAAEGNRALVQFKAKERFVRFVLPLPEPTERRFLYRKASNKYASAGLRNPVDREKAWEQDCRQAWRALLLIVKAKLEAVEAKITTFEDEFLPYTVLPNGETVAEWMQPQVDEAYKTGLMPTTLLALPAPKEATV